MADVRSLALVELRSIISDAAEVAKGMQIVDGGALENLSRHQDKLFCEARGSGAVPYRVSIAFGETASEVKARCSCMAARSRPFCKHAVALLVAWARQPESFVVSEGAPAAAEPSARKKEVKKGKTSASDLMDHGVEQVTTLVRELAVGGVATLGPDRVAQIRALGESLRESRLRRLSARTLDLAGTLEAGLRRRGHLDAIAYADLLADMLLTARKLGKHIEGEPLEDRHVEELIGKTWRKTDRKPVEGLRLVEYAFLANTTSDDFVIRESRFIDLSSGAHYSEKQILPAFLAKRTEPKKSYADAVLDDVRGSLYPGFAPSRLDIEGLPPSGPLDPSHLRAILDKALSSVGEALKALQEHRRDVFAPDRLPVAVRVDTVLAEGARCRVIDGNGEALGLPPDPALDESLGAALHEARLRALLGDVSIEGPLALLCPLAAIVEGAAGLALKPFAHARPGAGQTPASLLSTASAAHREGDVPAPVRLLDAARAAGAPPAAISLGEVRGELADALVTGLAGLVPRTTDPLVSRLGDLGLGKPAAVLAGLLSKPDPAGRLDDFVRVYQVLGIALVRLASATTVDPSTFERSPLYPSVAIQRPGRLLTPEETVERRIRGEVSRYEAAWHRARHYESLPADELLSDWPRFWANGAATPYVAQTLASAGPHAVELARRVLAMPAGRVAQITAIRILQAVGGREAEALLQDIGRDQRHPPGVRALAREALRVLAFHGRGAGRGFTPSEPNADLDACIEQLLSAPKKEIRAQMAERLERIGDPRALPPLRHAFRWDTAQEVREAATLALAQLGDTEMVEPLIARLMTRGAAPREAKAALRALAILGDVRAVPEMLHALVDNWAGPLVPEALHAVGLPALAPLAALVETHPEMAQRKSAQDILAKLPSDYVEPCLYQRIEGLSEDESLIDRASTILKLASGSDRVRKSIAHKILDGLPRPTSRPALALVKSARKALQASGT